MGDRHPLAGATNTNENPATVGRDGVLIQRAMSESMTESALMLQNSGLTRAEVAPRKPAIGLRIAIHRRKARQQLGPLRVGDGGDVGVGGVKALGVHTVGGDHLVLFQHEMDIGHRFQRRVDHDRMVVQHVLGRDQNLGRAEQGLGRRATHQQAVLGRDHQIGLGAINPKCLCLDADRAQMRQCIQTRARHIALPAPDDFLGAVVTRADLIAFMQILDDVSDEQFRKLILGAAVLDVSGEEP